jgi:hypothetical protein
METDEDRCRDSKRRASDTELTQGSDSKRQHVVASKIHGIAPIRKPRIGPGYQAVIPDLCTTPSAPNKAGKANVVAQSASLK